MESKPTEEGLIEFTDHLLGTFLITQFTIADK